MDTLSFVCYDGDRIVYVEHTDGPYTPESVAAWQAETIANPLRLFGCERVEYMPRAQAETTVDQAPRDHRFAVVGGARREGED